MSHRIKALVVTSNNGRDSPELLGSSMSRKIGGAKEDEVDYDELDVELESYDADLLQAAHDVDNR